MATTMEELKALLQQTPDDKRQALAMGLLNFGSGILANNKGHGGMLGPALGAGLQSGLQGYQGATQLGRQNRFEDLSAKMKLDEFQKQQEQDQKIKDMLSGMGSSPTENQFMQLSGVSPLAGKNAMDIYKTFNPTMASESPSFAPIQGSDSYWVFDRRTGKYTKPEGAPLSPSANPELQGIMSSAKKQGEKFGEAQASAQIDLPKVEQQTLDTIQQVDDLLKHPGMKQAVGASSMMGVQKVPGTSAYSFLVRLKQLQGGQFMQAYQTLKGGGQITEVEGKKATEAIARMDNAQSEEDFTQAAKEYQDVIKKGYERLRKTANQPMLPNNAQTLPNAQSNVIDFGSLR